MGGREIVSILLLFCYEVNYFVYMVERMYLVWCERVYERIGKM